MSYGGYYTFSLTYKDSRTSSSSIIEIDTNQPPDGGVIALESSIGVGLISNFKG